jgi:Cdc6-like AAA superfamily ATPase
MAKQPLEKKDKPPTKNDQLLEAYYMLARVIDQNTQMFEAVFNAISQMNAPETQEPSSDYPAIEEVRKKQKEKMVEVLEEIVNKCGRIKAEEFLDSFEAKSISTVAPSHYDVFIKSGEYLVKQYQGDII